MYIRMLSITLIAAAVSLVAVPTRHHGDVTVIFPGKKQEVVGNVRFLMYAPLFRLSNRTGNNAILIDPDLEPYRRLHPTAMAIGLTRPSVTVDPRGRVTDESWEFAIGLWLAEVLVMSALLNLGWAYRLRRKRASRDALRPTVE